MPPNSTQGWRGPALALLAGALFALGHVPFNLPFLSFAALPFLGWLVLSAAPSTVASLIPNAWWRHMGTQIEASMIKNKKQNH